MTFELIWTPKSEEKMRKLDRRIALRIVEKLESIKDIPRYSMEKLTKMDSWKLRVGDYRVICGIDEKNKKLVVETVGHRRNIYKK